MCIDSLKYNKGRGVQGFMQQQGKRRLFCVVLYKQTTGLKCLVAEISFVSAPRNRGEFACGHRYVLKH